MRLAFFLITLPLFSQVYLATPRRCGTHLLMYSLEYLTKHRWVVQNHIEWEWFDLGSDPQKERYIHSHQLYRLSNLDHKSDRLILLIRDYREALLREFGTLSAILNSKETYYFENLELFDTWDSKQRFLVYYEDLLTSPREVLQNILDFLEEENLFLDEYMTQWETHKQKVLRYYRRCGGSYSLGQDLRYHQSKLSPSDRHLFDATIQNRYPTLWQRYLNCYND